ncbi:MAG: diphosphomevalonate decarboxylase [Candidatus Lokiarchaeota archaeon]|nr:diphosphomevalonate decarboxylase [Candidatus Lokiarchaeota archaeon]
MMKASAETHPNIALIKYWGRNPNFPSRLNIPTNDSISMTKETIHSDKSNIELLTHTTIEFSENYEDDEGFLKTETDLLPFNEIQMIRIKKVVDPLRRLAQTSLNFKMVSENKFPTAAGLASSASAFAALATAASKALKLDLSKKVLTTFARLGSGSAARSIHGGFVRWHKGDSHETSFAEQICPCNEFDIAAVIAVIDRGEKAVSSDVGINYAHSSAFNPVRITESQKQAKKITKAILNDDFPTVGKIAEKSCLYMHSVMMTSEPALFYWNPDTLKVIKAIINNRRNEGTDFYFTVDAGPNVHCFCRMEDLDLAQNMLRNIGIPERNLVRVRQAEQGSKVVEKHLF